MAARCRSDSISPRSTASSRSIDSFYRGGHRDWPSQWFKAGDQYIERGRKALASGHRQTAGQMLFTGAVCYHLAGYMHHDIGRLLPETRHSMLRAVEIYWEAAPLLPLAAERRSRLPMTAPCCARSCGCRETSSARLA